MKCQEEPLLVVFCFTLFLSYSVFKSGIEDIVALQLQSHWNIVPLQLQSQWIHPQLSVLSLRSFWACCPVSTWVSSMPAGGIKGGMHFMCFSSVPSIGSGSTTLTNMTTNRLIRIWFCRLIAKIALKFSCIFYIHFCYIFSVISLFLLWILNHSWLFFSTTICSFSFSNFFYFFCLINVWTPHRLMHQTLRPMTLFMAHGAVRVFLKWQGRSLLLPDCAVFHIVFFFFLIHRP